MKLKYLKAFNEHHIQTNGRTFWGSIGAGILPICKKTKRILVGLRSEYVLEPNTWGSFGGKLDIDEGVEETIREGAIRELEEELRYNGHIELIDAFIFRSGSFEYHNFFGIVDEEFEPILDWENSDAKWMTIEELYQHPKKHFGLISLLKESGDLLEKIIK